MSSEVAIRLAGVGKAYNVYARPEDRLKQMVWRKRRRFYELFWALRDIDLEIARGETVGIIGRNGSGKSTLLQIIAGTLEPTCGEVAVNGRIAALLELGTGFNPEFTGRENVFLNAALLGLTDAEINERFDRIAAFADIGEFLDRPVKSYSSGMYARLAFAVAINVDPDILIVDEALAVGDEAFQRKCYARIKAIQDNGATILFVSHSGTILQLCDRAALLDGGECILVGEPKFVTTKYHKLAFAPPHRHAEIRSEILALRSRDARATDADGQDENEPVSHAGVRPEPQGGGVQAYFDEGLVPTSTVVYPPNGAQIENIRILDVEDRPVNVLVSGETYRYQYDVRFDRPADGVYFGMVLKTVTGLEIGGMGSHPIGEAEAFVEGDMRAVVTFRFRNILQPGMYFANAGVYSRSPDGELALHRLVDAVMFRVVPNSGKPWLLSGVVDLSEAPPCEIAFRAVGPIKAVA